jgi:hypothetical protein
MNTSQEAVMEQWKLLLSPAVGCCKAGPRARPLEGADARQAT